MNTLTVPTMSAIALLLSTSALYAQQQPSVDRSASGAVLAPGEIRVQSGQTQNGIPILSDVPIIGRLFQTSPGNHSQPGQAQSGIPVLSNVPIIGRLFQSGPGELPLAPPLVYKTKSVLAPDNPLCHLVSIQVKDATIAAIADALTTASGQKITVSPDMRRDRRMNIAAVNYPLAGVLETVAQRFDLCIMPQKNGVLLAEWPEATATGLRIRGRSVAAPWADDWKRPPYAAPGTETTEASSHLGPTANARAAQQDLSDHKQTGHTYRYYVARGTTAPQDLPELKQIGGPDSALQRNVQPGAAADRRLSLLSRTLDVKLEDVSLQQTLDSLSRIIGCPLRAAPTVPANIRIRLTANNTPLGTTLASLTKSTQTMLVPEEGGITLYPYPSLTVDGQKVNLIDRQAPWSPRWQDLPGYARTFADKPLNTVYTLPVTYSDFVQTRLFSPKQGAMSTVSPFNINPVRIGNAERGEWAVSRSPFNINPVNRSSSDVANQLKLKFTDHSAARFTAPRSLAALRTARSSTPLALTSLGNDRFVVAEKGVNKAGEAGYYLTIYKLEGKEIEVIGNTFHRAQAH
jgi:hypothetical protein